MIDRSSISSLTGRRAIWYARISRVAHALEPPMFGLWLAGGIHLATHQAGAIVLSDRRGARSGELTAPGLLLLAGVTLVAAALLFFHRKGRMLRQRLLAAAVATLFFVIGYHRELGSARAASFFGLATLAPATAVSPERSQPEYKLNTWGLRGPDFPERKPEGTSRVAVVGDSFVFGAGVDEPDTLPVALAARLRDRFPTARLEVLNLGVPDDNLASHLAMLRVAEQRLAADVLVLCLSLPDDLSAWDAQVERREHARIGGFSFMSYMFGHATAVTLWDERNLARDLTDQGIAFLRSEVARFTSERSTGSPRPLAIFAYSFEDPRVTAILRSIPGAVIVPPVSFDAAHHLADGVHPNAAGNAVFARRIATVFEAAWVGAK